MTAALINEHAYGSWKDREGEQVELVCPHENGHSMWVRVTDQRKPVSLPLRWLDVRQDVRPTCGQVLPQEATP